MSIRSPEYLVNCTFLIAGEDKEKLQTRIPMSGQWPEVRLKPLMKRALPTEKKKKLQPKTLRIKINKGKNVGSMAEWKGNLKNLCHHSFIHSFMC